ncbi:MAG: flagellar hook-length control protein FliK [Peptostreptococcaceae bacterium]|nr:flagellar hook-length control protein FliK [Peptostreptococcaceae bacterium]
MECAIKLNIGKKAEFTLSTGKAGKTDIGESVGKGERFEALMRRFMSVDGKNVETQVPTHKVLPEKDMLSALAGVQMEMKVIIEAVEIEDVTAGKELSEADFDKGKKTVGKVCLDNLGRFPEIPREFIKETGMMQDVNLKSESERLNDEAVAQPLEAGRGSEITDRTAGEWLQNPGAESVAVAGTFYAEQGLPDIVSEKRTVDKNAMFSPSAGVQENIQGLESKQPKNLETIAMNEDEKRFLHSARRQSVLNRLPEMQKQGQEETGTLQTGKGALVETGEMKNTAKPELKNTAKPELKNTAKPELKNGISEQAAKMVEGVPAIDTKIAGLETVKAETVDAARAITNFEEIGEKIEFGMNKARENGETVMRVRLKPEELGRIEIKLTNEDGAVKARIFVENEGVKEQLKNFLMDDRAFSRQNGLRLKEIEVSVFNQQTGNSEEFGQRAFDFQREARQDDFTDDFREERNDLLWQTEEGRGAQKGLDLFA